MKEDGRFQPAWGCAVDAPVIGAADGRPHPFVTATEFFDSLRAGRAVIGAGGPAVQSPDQVAEVILDLIRSGAEEADLVPADYG